MLASTSCLCSTTQTSCPCAINSEARCEPVRLPPITITYMAFIPFYVRCHYRGCAHAGSLPLPACCSLAKYLVVPRIFPRVAGYLFHCERARPEWHVPSGPALRSCVPSILRELLVHRLALHHSQPRKRFAFQDELVIARCDAHPMKRRIRFADSVFRKWERVVGCRCAPQPDSHDKLPARRARRLR